MKLVGILFISIILNAFTCHAQFPINSSGQIEYTEVVKIDSTTTASQLYARSKMFAAEVFKSAKDVVQNDDPANAVIMLKGNVPITYTWSGGLGSCQGHIDFSLSIMCKDGRYKYSLVPGKHYCHNGYKEFSGGYLLNEEPDCGFFNMPEKYWTKLKADADTLFKALLANLKNTMAKDLKGDDW